MSAMVLGWRFMVLAALLGGLTCRHQPRPIAGILQTQPTAGERPAEQLRDGLRITFDRPVAPPQRLGQPMARPGLVLDPPLAGETRWLDPQTLAFFVPEPRPGFQPSTRYVVTLADGLELAAGVELGHWKGLTFVHDRITIPSVRFDGDRQYAPARPVVTVTASQAVRVTDAVQACTFLERSADGSGGRSVAAVLVPLATGQPADARSFRLTPVQSLQPGRGYLFRCGVDFHGLEGNVGLAAVRDERFETHGPAGVKEVKPTGRDVAADNVPVEITFATPMDATEVRAHVTLVDDDGTTRPLELSAADSHLTTFTWSGDLEPGTHHELRIAAGLKDLFGQPITDDVRHQWTVGDASPRLRAQRGIYVVERSSGVYPVYTRNLSSFDVRCALVPEARLTAVLTGPANYDAWWEQSSGDAPDYDKLGLHVRTHTITPDGARNRWHDNGVDLPGLCGDGRAAGVYLLQLSGDRMNLASVTDLGLLAKVGNASSLVWVVRLSTGQPVANATVKIRDLDGKVRFSGRTGTDGVVEGPGAARLIGVKPHGVTPSGGQEGQDDPAVDDQGGDEDFRARRVVVTAQADDDLAVLDTNWNNGVQIWNFAVSQDRRGGQTRVRGFLHSDRGLYRPGDTAHLHGWARVVGLSGAMTVPRRRQVHLTLSDPRGTTLVEKDLPLTSFGGFALDFAVAAEARLGDYTIKGKLDDQVFSDTFSVEEYRPQTFEVKVKTEHANVVLGKPLKFELNARYLYGGPLADGKVTWTLRRRLHLARFPGYDDYMFQDMAALMDGGRGWARFEERSFSEPVSDGQVQLDAGGHLAVATRDEARGVTEPQDYLFEATVEDATGQAVTVGRTLTGHVADLYLGLHPSEFVQAVAMPFGVQVVGFNREGARRAAQAELTVTRRWYDCGYHDNNSYWSCPGKEDQKPALRRTVTVPAAGSAAVERVVLKDPGEYLVRITASDGHGHQASAAEIIYVVGPGEAFWSGDEGDRMTLIASKARYRPGETARLIPQAQMKGAFALTTLERDGVLWHRVQQLASSGEAVEIPIEPRLAPNAYASVALVRGRTGAGDAGRPRFKMGLVNLEVDASEQRLTVTVTTDRPSYRPGDKVTARIKVTAADGAPVRSELAVAVADEGVLQIKGYRTPDPMTAFYAPWGLGVESSTTLNRLLRQLDPTAGDDEEGGDGGGDEAGRIRSRFLATAFWAPAVVTGDDGTARVTFNAPDNLTAFRVMAVGSDVATRFGSGERRFTVAKPLQVTPALTRFLTVGDDALAAVLVANNSKTALRATICLTTTDVTLRGESTLTVALAAGASQRVAFSISAAREGAARLIFRATGGGQADAVEVIVPVQRPSVPETIVIGEGVARGRVAYAAPALGNVVPGHGAVEITLDTSGLSRLDEGLRYLVGYPYGCLEQTTSRVVPMVALTELSRAAPLPGVGADADKARGFITAGVAKILRHQHDDGGFGLWIGAPAEVHYTAYGLWGLTLAGAGGFPVDERALARGAAYLKRFVDSPQHSGPHMAGDAGDRAFAHFVLAALGQASPGGLTQLYDQRVQLPIYGRAFLARALIKAGRQAEALQLATELVALLPPGAGPATIRESEGDLAWYWSSDLRSTALVLSAVLEITPEHPGVRRLEQGLIAARVDGRWASTQENVHSLVALAALATRRAAGGDVPVTVVVGTGTPVHRLLRAGAVERVRVGLDQLAGGGIVIDSGGAEIFYAARVQLERPLDGVAFDHGIAIERAYLDPATGMPLGKIHLGQTVKVRLVVHAPARQAHVAIVDRLPAGFEPVLTRFRRSYAGDEGGQPQSFWWSQSQTAWQNVELRDDRVHLFADLLAAGASPYEYLVRATSAGAFQAPPVTAEAMYQPAVGGRSAAAMVTVVVP